MGSASSTEIHQLFLDGIKMSQTAQLNKFNEAFQETVKKDHPTRVQIFQDLFSTWMKNFVDNAISSPSISTMYFQTLRNILNEYVKFKLPVDYARHSFVPMLRKLEPALSSLNEQRFGLIIKVIQEVQEKNSPHFPFFIDSQSDVKREKKDEFAEFVAQSSLGLAVGRYIVELCRRCLNVNSGSNSSNTGQEAKAEEAILLMIKSLFKYLTPIEGFELEKSNEKLCSNLPALQAESQIPILSYLCMSDNPLALKLIRLLLEHGYNVDEPSSKRRGALTPLMYAAQNTSKQASQIIVELLMFNPRKDATDASLNTALHYAATNSANPTVCAELISAGGFHHVENSQGDTPIIKAIRCGASAAVVGTLFAGGASREDLKTKRITEMDQKGNEVEYSLMEHCVVHKHHELVGILFENGIEVEDKDKLMRLVARNDDKMKNILNSKLQ